MVILCSGAIRLHQHFVLLTFLIGVGGFIRHRLSGFREGFDRAELAVRNFVQDGSFGRGGNRVDGGPLFHHEQITPDIHVIVPRFSIPDAFDLVLLYPILLLSADVLDLAAIKIFPGIQDLLALRRPGLR